MRTRWSARAAPHRRADGCAALCEQSRCCSPALLLRACIAAGLCANLLLVGWSLAATAPSPSAAPAAARQPFAGGRRLASAPPAGQQLGAPLDDCARGLRLVRGGGGATAAPSSGSISACAWFPAPGAMTSDDASAPSAPRRQCCCLTLRERADVPPLPPLARMRSLLPRAAGQRGAQSGGDAQFRRWQAAAELLGELAGLAWREVPDAAAAPAAAASPADGGGAALAAASHPQQASATHQRLRRQLPGGAAGASRRFRLRVLALLASEAASLTCLPTLVIAGAQKSGTTALLGHLLLHPQFLPSRIKEPHHFDRADRLFEFESGGAAAVVAPRAAPTSGDGAGLQRYLSVLPSYWHEMLSRRRSSDATAADPGAELARFVASHVTGDATPSYVLGVDTARHLAAGLPEALVLVILREPASRAFSEYSMKVRRVRAQLDLSDAAVAARAARELLRQCAEPPPRVPCLLKAIKMHVGLQHVARSTSLLRPVVDCLVAAAAPDAADADAAQCLAGRNYLLEPSPGDFQELVEAEQRALTACSIDVAADAAGEGGRSGWAAFAAAVGLPHERTAAAAAAAAADAGGDSLQALATVPFCPATGGSDSEAPMPGDAAAAAQPALRLLLDGTPHCWPAGSTSNIGGDYLYRSVYANQVARLAAHFSADRLVVLADDALRSDAAAVMRRIQALAGLSELAPVWRRPPVPAAAADAAAAASACNRSADASSRDCARAPMLRGYDELRWDGIGPALLNDVIASEYGAFERTGWLLRGGYAPVAPALRASLRRFFRPYDAALRRLLGGCDVLQAVDAGTGTGGRGAAAAGGESR